ncbi:hypothetical protein [Acidithiobacillus ferrivorans]|uniref:Acid-shock protein n=1 Tax=Acidithiobacillus ferrivorans TaxID=160808 RepID=A0A7T4WDS7_9PROT|nr:hypothetical protein [Acidithiobacillus ferrivorans]QQD72562.1 hypothetical protein H2515_14475 [Acidithiobacillus ferrivorans]
MKKIVALTAALSFLTATAAFATEVPAVKAPGKTMEHKVMAKKVEHKKVGKKAPEHKKFEKKAPEHKVMEKKARPAA